MSRLRPISTRFPYTTLFRSEVPWRGHAKAVERFVFDLMHKEPAVLPDRTGLAAVGHRVVHGGQFTSSVRITPQIRTRITALDRKSTRLNSSHLGISYAVFCL